MAYHYKNYEPNKGLEAIQAEIFNQANNRNVKPEEIRERFERENIDPKTVIYAFDEKDQPVAYVQARDYPNRQEIHLGYPWAISGCPIDVQKKMYIDLLTYIKTRDSDLKIMTNIPDKSGFIEFVKAQKFIENRRTVLINVDKNSIGKTKYLSLPYSIKKATIEDLDRIKHAYFKALGDLARSDDENFTKFLSDCIESGYTYMAIKNDKIAGVCTNRVPDPETINQEGQFVGLQFFFALIGEEEAIPILMNNAIEVSEREKWNRNTIRIAFTDENPQEMAVLRDIAIDSKVISVNFSLLQ